MKMNNPFEAIEEIYIAHYPYLRYYLLKLTKDEEVADDIIQKLFSKILKDPARISQVQHIKSWLIKASKNTLLDYYKKRNLNCYMMKF